jgi:TonB family protein
LLVIHGKRVALVARGDGRQGLERRAIRPDVHGKGYVEITIQADSTGSFERALTTIFANGLAELSTSVPSYWKCYAASYFLPGDVKDNAESEVTQCAGRMDARAVAGGEPAYTAGPDILPPKMKGEAPVVYNTAVARELGIHGTAVVHLRIGIDGVPVGLQVVRALGAGLDEQALYAASRHRFSPAKREGVAVPVNVNIETHFALNP